MKNFNVGGSLENLICRGAFPKNQYIGGDCLKMGGLNSLQISKGSLGKKEGV